MTKEKNIYCKIDRDVLYNYVEAINSTKEPMNKIKVELKQTSKIVKEPFKSISIMSNTVKKMTDNHPNELTKVYIDTIKQIMDANNGMLSTRMIEPLNISRQYLLIMKNNNDIENVSRGIYLSTSSFEDSYFSFQQRYKMAIFSHMNALYFYGMTEEFPYEFTVTVPKNYHVNTVNKKCNVFYVSDDVLEMGVVEVKTPNGNKVRAYDRERCICDIIRSKNRMDPEQVQKAIKIYMNSKNKNIAKLSEYSKKMGISDKVMEIIGGLYYE